MHPLADYSLVNWLLILLGSFIIGLSKAGLKGIDMMNVTLMAIVFGGKASTGVILPLLCFADVLAVIYYNRHADWKHFWKLLPWMVIGILIGVYVGKDLDEAVFKRIMALIIILTIAMMVTLEFRKSTSMPRSRLFAAGMGLVSGFTTMLGNLAGAFSNIYFLAMHMPKNSFIGTAAWIFLVVNIFKLPFQYFYWGNINSSTLQTNLILIPTTAAGFWAGVKIVSVINDQRYRKIVIALTLIGAVFIFVK